MGRMAGCAVNHIEDTLRDLPVILDDLWTEAVGLRVRQRDALARLCEAVRGDGFYENLLGDCDEASDTVVGRPTLSHVIGAAERAARNQEPSA